MNKKDLELEVSDLKKRMLALEERVRCLEPDRIENGVLISKENLDYPPPHLGMVSEQHIEERKSNPVIGYFDSNEPVRGAAVNRGILGRDALYSSHSNEEPFKPSAYDADLPK